MILNKESGLDFIAFKIIKNSLNITFVVSRKIIHFFEYLRNNCYILKNK